MLWITVAFFVLLGLLFSGITGILLFSLGNFQDDSFSNKKVIIFFFVGVSWLFLNATSIFLCMWFKSYIQAGLEKCLAKVNKTLLRHKIVIALDDRGNISCHKIHLCFLYFDASQCVR